MVSITPPGEPVPITATFGFVCKWCGGERQVILGTSAEHVCSEYHSALEDFSFVIDEIHAHEGRPSAAEQKKLFLAQLKQEAAEAIQKAAADKKGED